MKKNILIAVLFIIIVLMGGTFFYLYTNQDKIFDKCPIEERKENEEKKEEINARELGSTRYIQDISYDDGLIYCEVVISKEGEAFVYFDKSLSTQIEEAINNIKKQYKNYSINGYHESRTEPNETKDFVGIKLPIDNVVAAYKGYYGNSGPEGTYIYFLKTDGTISGFSIGETFLANNGNIEFKNNINNLKNIITIVQSSTTTGRSEANEVLAIDSKGNEYKLNNIDD